MLTIELKFLTGKWHATPWGRQVNEGAVEWPPAPWRILRTLLAVWHHKHPEVSEAGMRELIDMLASELPVYHLPSHAEGHTRHYMPVANDNKTKIFDTFLTISPQETLQIHWPEITLSDAQSELLDQLLKSISYFGRAESWIDARLGSWKGNANASPLNGSPAEDHQEIVRLLAPGELDQYANWREEMVTDSRNRKLADKKSIALAKGKPIDKIKLSKNEIEKIKASIPEDFFAALHMETSELRQAGWNRPPASQWVTYVREKQIPSISKSAVRKKNELPTVARYAIAGAVLPKLTDAIFLSERVRCSLIKFSDGSPLFIGRESKEKSSQLAQGHQHAHFFCESNNNLQGRITHVSIFAPQGFDNAAEEALCKFNKTWGSGGHDLQFVLIGIGHPSDFGGSNEKKGEAPIFAQSKIWVSRTPFVPADRLRRQYRLDDPLEKSRCEKDLARIIRKELERRNWLHQHHATLASITLMDPKTKLGGHDTSWLNFRRERTKGGGKRGNTSGFGIKLKFSQPVEGPIALGYASHFSLGLFVPG
ncbi:type I-U CRISPR-associated protein Csb2 [Rubinisphaera sp.]|uniref:type I-G CRISPR-associated protein Csb2 n=1 Tax=Rubinisphaera sp. TaxID=2024857 RepID=UPI000C1213B6|nr:type I-U CRISPR-associated protein Csb2 [Rubinisphaera sp.]MBV10238.1 type I-U CRISPR-associated protein Cas5/Cas6 [Rubinisphaera sp.]HCS54132.1 type I-U CRISPR-associated protein Cas5/Cas6 [Planctomycetaceae bacterium]|tara:strand:- start:455 stop:2068 length:1614 start_codon:yes stop_codon:yes gene_type:complete